ncbi:hypothetical protein KR059_011365 [Drosophila kikkawai]|nr:hypothetical protein KR059_011365 [Drosophila kikkawai]
MKISWQTFPKLIIVLPLLHFILGQRLQAESEELKRRKESEQPNAENVNIAWLMRQQEKLRKSQGDTLYGRK